MSATRARLNPELTVGELSPHLVGLTPSEVIAPATWQSLAPLVRAVPGPVVGFEQPVNDSRPGEWGPRCPAGSAQTHWPSISRMHRISLRWCARGWIILV